MRNFFDFVDVCMFDEVVWKLHVKYKIVTNIGMDRMY